MNVLVIFYSVAYFTALWSQKPALRAFSGGGVLERARAHVGSEDRLSLREGKSSPDGGSFEIHIYRLYI